MDFDASIVDQIYHQEVQGAKFMIRRIMMLEFSQYLENYLWPNYKPENSSASHVLSIVIMVNEKFRERVSAWQVCVFQSSLHNISIHAIYYVVLF